MSLLLPPHLSDAFNTAVELLSPACPNSTSYWAAEAFCRPPGITERPRTWTFLCPSAALGPIQGLRHDRMHIAVGVIKKHGHLIEGFDAENIAGVIAGVKFSVGVANWMHLTFGRDTVQASRAQAAAIEEVFIGKIHGRFRYGRQIDGRIPIRDLYDMTVCMREQPSLLQSQFAQLKPEQMQTYAKRLRDMPTNWHELMRAGSLTLHTTWTWRAFRNWWRAPWSSGTHP